ncbi:MAG: hypothetical protein IJY26_02055 [Clostridia bacterium]|nr:hypothetical protein [Clostridia bacterium]
MSLKNILKSNPVIYGLYKKWKKKRIERAKKNNLKCRKVFIDRSKGKEKLCVILAGYKEFLYPAVFSRIKRFTPDDVDVCVVTSGLYSQKVHELCEENGWSYLRTNINNVSLAQNVAISLHPNAKYIYKLDEDIFITEGYFDNLYKAYQHATEGLFQPGVMAPIIPINGYGHVRVLEKTGLTDYYATRFEPPKYMAGGHRQIEGNPEVAKFFWADPRVPSIDELNARFIKEEPREYPCPIRFSIGAVLFERTLWEDMGYFRVNRRSNAMGDDEVQLCEYCCIQSRPLMVSENVVVGHLSFGPQNAHMQEFFLNNTEKFM